MLITLELDAARNQELETLAAARATTPETILNQALDRYLEQEKKEKKYPARTPVGGIITPV